MAKSGVNMLENRGNMLENGGKIGRNWGNMAENGGNMAGSTLVVTECAMGQRVWVRAIRNDMTMLGDGRRLSSFSGFLLKRSVFQR